MLNFFFFFFLEEKIQGGKWGGNMLNEKKRGECVSV